MFFNVTRLSLARMKPPRWVRLPFAHTEHRWRDTTPKAQQVPTVSATGLSAKFETSLKKTNMRNEKCVGNGDNILSNVPEASRQNGVQRFLFSSSGFYNQSKQQVAAVTGGLRVKGDRHHWNSCGTCFRREL